MLLKKWIADILFWPFFWIRFFNVKSRKKKLSTRLKSLSSSKLVWSSMSFCVPLCYRNHVSDFYEFLCKFQKLLHDRMILTCLCISVWISTMARRSKMSKKEFDDQFEAFLKDVNPVLSIYRFNKKITGLCNDIT